MVRLVILSMATMLSCANEKVDYDLQQCLEDEDYQQSSEETHAYFGDWISNLYTPGLQVLSIHISGEDNNDTLWRVDARFDMVNYADNDCPMAIYRSTTKPDLDSVLPITSESVLPETDENLGSLLFAVNLAPSDSEEVWLEVQDYNSEMDFHLTWVTCENPRVHDNSGTAHFSSAIGIEFEGCQANFESPGGYSTSDSPETPAGFTIDLSHR